MAIEQLEYCTAETNVIASLADKPNAQSGMTAAQLKAKFDAADAAIKAYINDTLVPYVNGTLAAAIEAPITTDKLASGLLVPLANGGTGNTDGLAQAAKKLETARTIQTDLSGNSAASFDGTDNVTPGVTGILPIEKGGTGASSASVALYALTPNNYPSPSFVLSLDAAGHTDGGGFTTLGQLQAALGVVSITKLWENASPTSSFESQTLYLDIAPYDFLLIFHYGRVGPDSVTKSGYQASIVPIGVDTCLSNTALVGSTADFVYEATRAVWADRANRSVWFARGMYVYTYGASPSVCAKNDNAPNAAIPYQIYGIKGVT